MGPEHKPEQTGRKTQGNPTKARLILLLMELKEGSSSCYEDSAIYTLSHINAYNPAYPTGPSIQLIT